VAESYRQPEEPDVKPACVPIVVVVLMVVVGWRVANMTTGWDRTSAVQLHNQFVNASGSRVRNRRKK
jgi:hypothetical protein